MFSSFLLLKSSFFLMFNLIFYSSVAFTFAFDLNELKWCRDNVAVISNRANKLYTKITQTPEKDRNLTRRCCDFKKLESVLEKWLSKSIEQPKPLFSRAAQKSFAETAKKTPMQQNDKNKDDISH